MWKHGRRGGVVRTFVRPARKHIEGGVEDGVENGKEQVGKEVQGWKGTIVRKRKFKWKKVNVEVEG